MANATVAPTLAQIVFFQWATPSAPSPKLSAPVGPTDTTLTFTSAPLDTAGVVVTEAFLMGIRNDAGYVETVYVPAGTLSGDGLTATGVVRGIELSGLDWTVGDSNNAATHQQDSPVFCNITGVMQAIQFAAMQGTIATGGSGLIIGTDAAGTVTLSRSTGVGTNSPWLRWNSAGSEVEFSDDGVAWTAINDVTASNLVDVSAADTTPGYVGAKVVGDGTTTSTTILNPGANEELQITANGNLADVIADVTATSTEINDALDGISANVTFTNLNTLTAGSTSDGDALHTHSSLGGGFTLTASENITGAATAQAVSIGSQEYKTFVRNESAADAMDYSGGAQVNLGEVDNRTWMAQAVTFTDVDADAITVESLGVMIGFNGNPTGTVYCEIQGDSGGSPNGVTIPNGTSGALTANTLATATKDAINKFTWATPPEVTSGTTYWFVFKRSVANDAVNFLHILTQAVGATGGDIGTFGVSKTYTASTLSWAASANPMCIDIRLNLDYGGGIYLSDANHTRKGRFIGFVNEDVADGALATVQPVGIIRGLSGLTPGNMYFASTTGGSIDDTPTAGNDNMIIPIGEAVSATQLLVNKGLKMMRKTYNSIKLVVNAAAKQVDYDIFFETGFKPQYIRAYVHYSSTAVNEKTAGRMEAVYGSNVEDVQVRVLDANYRTLNATSNFVNEDTLGHNANDEIEFSNIYENGFDLNMRQLNLGNSPITIEIVASGY